jgi:cell filamentation protein
MSDIYQFDSKYCYPGNDVLINIPGLRDQKQLEAYERMVTADRLRMLELRPLKGNFDLKHLCQIHKFIFKDIYPFAGELRNEEISKGNFLVAHFRFIEPQTKLHRRQTRTEHDGRTEKRNRHQRLNRFSRFLHQI